MDHKKLDRLVNGPNWGEVVIGAIISAFVGMALGATYLVLKPVVRVKTYPEKPDKEVVYYVDPGSSSGGSKNWLRKRQLFVEGESVSVSQPELNAWVHEGMHGDAKTKAPAEDTGWFQPGDPQFRLVGDELYVGVPTKLVFFGLERQLTAQASGKFVRNRQGHFVFAPDRYYLGSLPLHKMPAAAQRFTHKVMDRQVIPEEVTTAWERLNNVRIEKGTLWLDAAPPS